MKAKVIFVLGGTGFIGSEVVRQAVGRGFEVRALARSDSKAEYLGSLGAVPVLGDALEPAKWIDRARGAEVLIDLTQPELPGRIRPRDIESVARARREMVRALLAALGGLSEGERPLLVCASGTDDLAPDARGRIEGTSPLRASPVGFGRIGIPLRRLVESTGTSAAFLYLGTVYGPGKSFAASIFPRLARGRMALPAPAENRLPLIHVLDAARAVVHLAGLGRERLEGRGFLLVDPEGGARLGQFFDEAAEQMAVAPPRQVPAWLFSAMAGRVLFETLSRDLDARPSELLSTGFRFTYPSIREGLASTLRALGYGPGGPGAPNRRGGGATKWLGAAAAAMLALANTPGFPWSAPTLRAMAGGEPMLDMRMGYASDAVYRLFDALGVSGRQRYLEEIWTLDLALPAICGLFLFSAIRRGALKRWRWLGLLAGAADYLENSAVTGLLLAHPARREGLAILASALTTAKFLLYFGAVGLAGLGGWLARRGQGGVGDLRPSALRSGGETNHPSQSL